MAYTLKELRTIAAKLTGAAIQSLFPKAYRLGGDVSDYGFYYDFILENETLDAQGFTHLEERMHDLCFRGVHAKTTEMVRDNAADLLKYRHQPYLSQQLQECPSGLVQLIRIEDFYDICSVEFEGTVNTLGVFRLLQKEERVVEYPGIPPLKVVRVTGTLFKSQQELKDYLKNLRDTKGDTHQVVGEKLRLFLFDDRGRCYWLPKGVKLRNLLIERWRVIMVAKGFDLVDTPDDGSGSRRASHCTVQALSGGSAFAELFPVPSFAPQQQFLGLWRSPCYLRDEARRYCTAGEVKEVLISSLQFISEMVNILGSGFHWRIGGEEILSKKQRAQNQPARALLTEAMQSCGLPFVQEEGGAPTATLYLTDCYGKPWAGPRVSLEVGVTENKEPAGVAVVMQLWGSLERFIAWLLEHRHEAKEKKNVGEIRSNGSGAVGRFDEIDRLLQQL